LGPRGLEGVMVGPDGKARKIRPGDPPPAGVQFFAPGEFDPFEFAFGRSFATPAPSAVDLRQAQWAFRRGDFRGSLKALDEQARQHPNQPDLDQARALAYHALGRFADSGKVARRALEEAAPWDWSRVRSFYDRSSDY